MIISTVILVPLVIDQKSVLTSALAANWQSVSIADSIQRCWGDSDTCPHYTFGTLMWNSIASFNETFYI